LQPILAIETNVELVSKATNRKALSFEGPGNFLELDENNPIKKGNPLGVVIIYQVPYACTKEIFNHHVEERPLQNVPSFGNKDPKVSRHGKRHIKPTRLNRFL
jgi:hypothetical protein